MPLEIHTLINKINGLLAVGAGRLSEGQMLGLQQLTVLLKTKHQSIVKAELDQIQLQLDELTRIIQGKVDPLGPSRVDNIMFTVDDVKVTRKNAYMWIYEKIPLQCQQCGLRFIEDEEGKKQLSSHMDWHFRHNKRKDMERAKNIVTRSWYPKASVIRFL